MLWVRDADQLNLVRPVKVRTGISDGIVTEVMPMSGETTLEGMLVVVGEQREAGDAESTETTNPFAPKFPGHGPRR